MPPLITVKASNLLNIRERRSGLSGAVVRLCTSRTVATVGGGAFPRVAAFAFPWLWAVAGLMSVASASRTLRRRGLLAPHCDRCRTSL